jgi:2-(3-amino-3-carboxypropyl)histidine synthase
MILGAEESNKQKMIFLPHHFNDKLFKSDFSLVSMKVLYIESKLKNLNIALDKQEITKLPKKIFLAYSIQFKDIAFQIKKQLESNNIQVTKIQQVLGCSKINTKDPVLLIGSGRFHAINLFLQANKIFLLEGNKVIPIQESEIQSIKNKRKAALIRFLNAENIGILVSTKPGQENIKLARELMKKLEKKGKKAYIFIANNIDTNQFENFPIDSWINTSCPGLSLDNSKIIDCSEIPRF